MLCRITWPYPIEIVAFPVGKKVRCGPIQTVIQRSHQGCKICKLGVSSRNAGTMHGRESEVVETLGRRHIAIYCVQESR